MIADMPKSVREIRFSLVIILAALLLLSCQREDAPDKTEYVTPRWPASAGGKWGFIDAKGAVVIPFAYKAVEPFAEGRAAVFTDSIWGFVDTTGALVIPPQFHRVNPFADGRARVQTVQNPYGFGYIDHKGNVVIPVDTTREEERDFASRRAAIRRAGKYGYLDPFGRVAIPGPFSAGGKFHNGLAPARLTELWGLIDTTGNWVAPAKFSWMESPREGVARARVTDGGKPIWCLVDARGEIIAQLDGFSEVGPMSEGRARAKKDNLWGYLDPKGKFAIKPQFIDAISFSEGLAGVRSTPGGKWGFINRKGKQVIPESFDLAGQFRGGFAAVQQADRWGYIDKTGKYVWQAGKGELALPPGIGEER